MKIQNPHDKFFKETFSDVTVAKDFINNYLPDSIVNIIDINTLEPQKDSFINEKLQEGIISFVMYFIFTYQSIKLSLCFRFKYTFLCHFS